MTNSNDCKTHKTTTTPTAPTAATPRSCTRGTLITCMTVTFIIRTATTSMNMCWLLAATTPPNAPPEHRCGGHDASHRTARVAVTKRCPGGDHIDYLVDGHLHHPHGDHCDDHGPVEFAGQQAPKVPKP